jgi:hypothetical protein
MHRLPTNEFLPQRTALYPADKGGAKSSHSLATGYTKSALVYGPIQPFHRPRTIPLFLGSSPVKRSSEIAMAGRVAPSPPRRTHTMSSLFRRGTSRSDKSPEVELKEEFIPKYELEWGTLKSWLDERFKSYNCSFARRYNVVGIHTS